MHTMIDPRFLIGAVALALALGAGCDKDQADEAPPTNATEAVGEEVEESTEAPTPVEVSDEAAEADPEGEEQTDEPGEGAEVELGQERPKPKAIDELKRTRDKRKRAPKRSSKKRSSKKSRSGDSDRALDPLHAVDDM